MSFPVTRLRRLRRNATFRRMVRETRVSADNLIMPLFVRPGTGIMDEIPSMPGNYQCSIDALAEQAQAVAQAGVPAVILFGIPESKDALGSPGYEGSPIVCEAVEAIKKDCPELCVITDVCLCEYTDHGHCGVIRENLDGVLDVDNDATL